LGTHGLSDNHNLELLCLQLLNESIEKSNPEHGINFIVSFPFFEKYFNFKYFNLALYKVFFGQKYGVKNLPSRIELEDFEDIQMELRFKQDKNRRFSKIIKKTFKTTMENTFAESVDETIEVVNSASTIRESSIPPPAPESTIADDAESLKDALKPSISSTSKSAKKILKFLKTSAETIDKNQEIENSENTKDAMRISLATPGSVTESVKESRRVTISEPPNGLADKHIKNSNETAKEIRRVTISTSHESETVDEIAELSMVTSASSKSRRVTIAVPKITEEVDDEVETASQKSKSRKTAVFIPEIVSVVPGKSENPTSSDRGNKSVRNNNDDLSILNQWYDIDKSYSTEAYLLKPIRYKIFMHIIFTILEIKTFY
jgi:hypothetical protein